MLFLWVFGRRVEDACGPWRYLVFYLICGMCADLLSTMIRFEEMIPGIGASSAIAGLLGAYLILFPGGRNRTFVWLFVFPALPRVRAFCFLDGFFASVFVIFFLRPEHLPAI